MKGKTIRSVGLRLIHVASIAMSIVVPAAAQDFSAGEPIGARSEAGEWRPMSDNVKVYGSFHFTESCTFDPGKNLILAMNAGNRSALAVSETNRGVPSSDGKSLVPEVWPLPAMWR